MPEPTTADVLTADEWRAVMRAIDRANHCYNDMCGHVDDGCMAGSFDSLIPRVQQAMKWTLFDEAVHNGILDGLSVEAATPEADARLAAQPEPSAPEGLEVEGVVTAAYRAWVACGETGWAHNGGKPCVISQHAAAYREATRPEPTFIGSEFCAPHYHVAGPKDRCGECGHDLRARCHHREATR